MSENPAFLEVSRKLEFREGPAVAAHLRAVDELLRTATGSQLDSVMDPRGTIYLLPPAQDRLRQNEARLQSVLDSCPDLITVISRGGMILSESGALTAMLGFPASTLDAQVLYDFIHPEDLPELERCVFGVIEEVWSSASTEFGHRTSTGLYQALEATLSKVRGPGGPSVVLVCRRSRGSGFPGEARRRAAAVPERLLGTQAEVLELVLAPALLAIGLLQEDDRFADGKSALGLIRGNLERQAQVLKGLFDLAQATRADTVAPLPPVDLGAAVDEVLQICQPDLAARPVSVLVKIHPSAQAVLANPVQLRQILWNLLKNAVKFSEREGVIRIIAVKTTSGRINIEVTDSGRGIEAARLPFIFDTFRTESDSAHAGTQGLGLGLYVARALARAQHGTVVATSAGPGLGATFALTLRAASAAGPAATEPQNVPVRILLVEGDEVSRSALGRLLAREGHVTSAAPDGAAALRLVVRGEYDLLICNASLPDRSGCELVEQVRLARPAMKAIALSGYGATADIQRSHAAGFSAHLVMPVAMPALRKAIADVSAEWAPGRAVGAVANTSSSAPPRAL